MASKRHVRQKQCGHKRHYPDVKAAKSAAVLLFRHTGEKLTSYHCKFCGRWHIGHRPGSGRWRLPQAG
jgi:hypothetical protein